MTPLNITLRSADQGIISIDVAGRISKDGWPPNRDPLVGRLGPEVYTSTILMNLRNADYIDSTGVEWLLWCHSRCEQAGGRLIVHSPNPMTDQLLRMMRMDLTLHLAGNEKDALELAGEFSNEHAGDH
ncbi:hypothetical protein Mal4_33600 [Maioricimonas rarisocia]|uniref:STAS domain-containing protein n=1 Tax=Maioricimonas rarisocia TaxID=2528026 RepID=A0A517Z969_9PLAN|nr:STAS domain-containing protein [Maioricimonas rarisocia]QDU39027.1 hypothetical protein Mal4_33600 [Maioricimonas rarisocia]